ncbi:MAG TPA: DUF5665 domain-containing protein [Candidatus Nanoarchaeia archaeon]
MAKEDAKSKEYIEVGSDRGHTRIHISTWRMVFNNFLGGLSWGFGTVLGATVVVGLVIIILSKLDSVPIIGEFFSSILQSIQP